MVAVLMCVISFILGTFAGVVIMCLCVAAGNEDRWLDEHRQGLILRRLL